MSSLEEQTARKQAATLRAIADVERDARSSIKACRTELAKAMLVQTQAKLGLLKAVRAARRLGWSWDLIGSQTGVTKQPATNDLARQA